MKQSFQTKRPADGVTRGMKLPPWRYLSRITRLYVLADCPNAVRSVNFIWWCPLGKTFWEGAGLKESCGHICKHVLFCT